MEERKIQKLKQESKILRKWKIIWRWKEEELKENLKNKREKNKKDKKFWEELNSIETK